MDNDNKVNKNTTGSVKLFLEKELVPLKQKSSKVYDLEKEFSRTKKNHSAYIPLTLFFCLLMMAGIVYGAYKFIYSKEYSAEISGDVFDSMVTEDIETEIRRTNTLYQASLSYLKELDDLEKKELTEAERQYNYNLYVIDSMNIADKKDVKHRKDAAKSDYKKSLQEIRENYSGRKQDAQAESNQYKAKLDSYSEQAVKNAVEESDLNQEQVLAKIEKEKLVQDYEKRIAELQTQIDEIRAENLKDKKQSIDTLSKKYRDEIAGLDPFISDQRAASIISSSSSIKKADFTAGNYSSESKVSSISLYKALVDADKKYEDYKYLYNSYANLPQKNTIPSYVKTGHRLVVSASNEVADTAVQVVNQLSSELSHAETVNKGLESVLYSVMKSAGLKAIVLSAGSEQLELFVDEELQKKAAGGSVKASFQSEGETYIGTIICSDGHFYFIPESSAENTEAKPDFSTVASGTTVKVSE